MTEVFANGPPDAGAGAVADAGLDVPFDWSDQALAHPKILVIGPKGSGKRQYMASLPYAPINWNTRDDIVGVVPAGVETVARMATALYYPGEISDEGEPAIYDVVVRPRTVRRESVLGNDRVTLADIPTLVFREPTGTARINAAIWHDNPPLRIGNETLPVQDHVATAIGFVFIVDPFTPVDRNAFVGDVLEGVEQVHAEWREAGVSSLPSAERPLPVAVVTTKTDALHPGDPRVGKDIGLRDIIGRGEAERVARMASSIEGARNASRAGDGQFRIHCNGVSAWGEGPGVRYAGTRFDPDNVLAPIQQMFRSFPRLVGTRVWDLSRAAE